MPAAEQQNGSRGLAKLNYNYPMLDDNKCVYLWGDPGCGKTFVMEQFYENLDLQPHEKMLLHYQEFMLRVHEREHKINKKLRGKSGDTITAVANEFSKDLLFLCIDEF